MGSCPDTDIDPGTVWLKFLFFFFLCNTLYAVKCSNSLTLFVSVLLNSRLTCLERR